MSRNRVIIIGITFVLVVTVVIAVIAFSPEKSTVILDAPDWQTSTVPENVADPDSSKVVDVKDLPLESIDGWQRYVNEELGFSVDYPEGWFVRDYWKDPRPKPVSKVGFFPWSHDIGGDSWIVSRENATGLPEEQLEEILNATSTDPRYVSTRTEIVHGGYPAVHITSKNVDAEVGGIVSHTITIPRGQYIYSASAIDYSQAIVPEEVMDYGEAEGVNSYRNMIVFFKELNERGYHQTFLDSFRILE